MGGATLKGKLEERWKKLGEGPEVEDALKRGGKLSEETVELRRRAAVGEGEPGREEEEEDSLEYREVFSSGRKKDAEPAIVELSLVEIKERAKEALLDEDYEEAEGLYTEGLMEIRRMVSDKGQDCGSGGGEGGENRVDYGDMNDAASILYSNRSLVRKKQQRWLESIADAYAAHKLRPDWAKPYYRIAQAKACQLEYRGAIAACRQGQKLLDQNGSRSTEFVELMDQISNAAFLAGSLAGFDGRLLQVRSAGEEAWLGREAPANPLIDEVPEELSMNSLGLDDSGDVDSGTRAALVAKRKNDAIQAGTAQLSFRSIRDAVEEAKDGDRILILRGIHNTGGTTIFVNKRILIRSEGTLEETTIDHRGNSPIFRLTRSAVLQNINIDMTGFRESVFVYGGPEVSPVIEHCKFTCSGDGAISVAGRANPVVRRCEIASCKKVGLKLFEQARGEYVDLRITSCQQQAVKLMERSSGKFYNCSFTKNEEEGVVVMDAAEAVLRDCVVAKNSGPGADVSGKGKIAAENCQIEGNVGGLWLWDSAKAVVSESTIEGGTSHVILADGDSLPRVVSCTVEGMIQATEEAWEGICMETNTLIEPLKSVELPPESGPFHFEPVWYERKQ